MATYRSLGGNHGVPSSCKVKCFVKRSLTSVLCGSTPTCGFFVVSVSETFHLSFHLRTTTYQRTIGKAYSVIIIAREFINNNYNTKLGNS